MANLQTTIVSGNLTVTGSSSLRATTISGEALFSGRVGITNSNQAAMLHVGCSGSGIAGLVIKGATSQTGNLLEVKNSANGELFTINKLGHVSSQTSFSGPAYSYVQESFRFVPTTTAPVPYGGNVAWMNETQANIDAGNYGGMRVSWPGGPGQLTFTPFGVGAGVTPGLTLATETIANTINIGNSAGTNGNLIRLSVIDYTAASTTAYVSAHRVASNLKPHLVVGGQSINFYLGQAEGYNYGATFAKLSADSKLSLNASTDATSQLDVNCFSSATVGEIIKGAASQSADLLQAQNSSSTVLAQITSNGTIKSSVGVYVGNDQLSSVLQAQIFS